MEYEIVKLNELSGGKATLYSIIPRGSQNTLFDQFLEDYESDLEDETDDIINRLYQIGHETGARESFFKLNEGKDGDGVCALYDLPDKQLRLYCIRFGTDAVILGGGGIKKVRSWQDDEILKQAASSIIEFAKDIMIRMQEKEIWLSPIGNELEGNLKNYDDDDE